MRNFTNFHSKLAKNSNFCFLFIFKQLQEKTAVEKKRTGLHYHCPAKVWNIYIKQK